MNYQDFSIEDHIISCDAGYRGGGIKVDVAELFPEVEAETDETIIGAYQNYLGGGLLGAVVGGASFSPENLSKKQKEVFFALKEDIKEYFHSLTNHEGDEWEEASYSENQLRPVSAY